jgi:hypothetical protein
VSAGGWLERLGTCRPTKRGPTTFVGEQVGCSLMQECGNEGTSSGREDRREGEGPETRVR